MQIQTNSAGELEIKTKKATITFNHETKVNDVDLEGAGEYEIGSVSIEGVDDDIYIFQAEEIIFGSVDFKGKISKENLEKLSNTEILIVRLDGNVTEAVDQANQIEPNITIFAGSADVKSKLTTNGTVFENKEILKVSKSDIADQKAYFIEVKNGKEAPQDQGTV